MNEGNPKKHSGGCHCGAVRFEVEVDATCATRCNCTVCMKLGLLSALVRPAAFTLLSGKESLRVYQWGAKIGTRFFCGTCGAHCYASGHLAEVGGDFVSVNVNCLEDVELSEIKVMYWDGRHDNWGAGPRDTPWPVFARTAA